MDAGGKKCTFERLIASREVLVSFGIFLCIPGTVMTATLYLPDRENPVGPILLCVGGSLLVTGIILCAIAKKQQKEHVVRPVVNRVSAAPAETQHPWPPGPASPARPMPHFIPPPPYETVHNYGPPPNRAQPTATGFDIQGGFHQYIQYPSDAPPPYPGADAPSAPFPAAPAPCPPPDPSFGQNLAYPPPPPPGQRY